MLPVYQSIAMVERGRIIVSGPAIGMHQYMAMQVEQGNEPFPLAGSLGTTRQFCLSLVQQQCDNRQLRHAFYQAAQGKLSVFGVKGGKLL